MYHHLNENINKLEANYNYTGTVKDLKYGSANIEQEDVRTLRMALKNIKKFFLVGESVGPRDGVVVNNDVTTTPSEITINIEP